MLKYKTAARSKVLLFALSILVFLVSSAAVWNTLQLRREIRHRTLSYVSDVTDRLVKDIDNRLSSMIDNLEIIGESLLQIESSNSTALWDFLEQESQGMGFTSLIAIGMGDPPAPFQPATAELLALPGIQASFAGQSGVSLLDEQSILYSIPLRRDDRVVGVLGGVRDKQNMQELIRLDSFSGTGLTCIVDKTASAVISPTDLDPFLQLEYVFTEDPDGAAAQQIYRMSANIREHRAGAFQFEAVDGSKLILAYTPLHSYNWILLTLVPADVLSSRLDGYMGQTYLAVGGIIVLMAAMLLILFLYQRSYRRQFENAVFVDRVTGGMTNIAFQFKCKSLLPHAPPGTYCVAVLNIQNFKLINEQFGSERGDRTLQKLMRVAQARTAGIGFVARSAADLFFLCLKTGDPSRILQIIGGILEEMDQAVRQYNQSASIPFHFVVQSGVYIVDDPALEITIIQDRANAACRNRAAWEDGVCKFYDISITKRLELEQELNSLFEESLVNRHFQVYLQPKVWAAGGRIGGAEALIRWRHPKKGILPPSDFIPLFESNGAICKLDLYVFEEVCRTLRRWMDAGWPLIPISVNLSRQHFQQSDCLRPFAELAGRYGIPKGILELELTESLFLDDHTVEVIKTHNRELHQMGFLCSLDDFGSGFSFLGLLAQFDVDAVKIDRRFFRDIENPKTKDIIASIVALTRKIGAQAVAEGIETQEQLALLQEVGCDLVQGYLYAKPMPIPEFEAWCAEREPSPCG